MIVWQTIRMRSKKAPILLRTDESMQALLTAIRYDLSLDPAKTEKQIKKRMSDLTTVVNHLAKSLNTTPDRLTVSSTVEGESTFLDYLDQSRLHPQVR